MNDIQIHIVPDECCPECGQEGSPKVADEDGVWHWKCFTPYDKCTVGYWVPGEDRIERKLPPAEQEAFNERIRREVQESMRGKRWITQGNCSRMIPDEEPLPAGWREGP